MRGSSPPEREQYDHGYHSPDAAWGAQPALLSRRSDRQPQAPGRPESRARGILQPDRPAGRDQAEARSAAHRLLGREGGASVRPRADAGRVLSEAGDGLTAQGRMSRRGLDRAWAPRRAV